MPLIQGLNTIGAQVQTPCHILQRAIGVPVGLLHGWKWYSEEEVVIVVPVIGLADLIIGLNEALSLPTSVELDLSPSSAAFSTWHADGSLQL